MEYARHFKFLVCARNFDETDLEGARLRDILNEVERLSLRTRRTAPPSASTAWLWTTPPGSMTSWTGAFRRSSSEV